MIGVQIGTRLGAKLPSEQFRVTLALLVLVTCGKILFDLVATPSFPYSIVAAGDA